MNQAHVGIVARYAEKYFDTCCEENGLTDAERQIKCHPDWKWDEDGTNPACASSTTHFEYCAHNVNALLDDDATCGPDSLFSKIGKLRDDAIEQYCFTNVLLEEVQEDFPTLLYLEMVKEDHFEPPLTQKAILNRLLELTTKGTRIAYVVCITQNDEETVFFYRWKDFTKFSKKINYQSKTTFKKDLQENVWVNLEKFTLQVFRVAVPEVCECAYPLWAKQKSRIFDELKIYLNLLNHQFTCDQIFGTDCEETQLNSRCIFKDCITIGEQKSRLFRSPQPKCKTSLPTICYAEIKGKGDVAHNIINQTCGGCEKEKACEELCGENGTCTAAPTSDSDRCSQPGCAIPCDLHLSVR